MRIPAWTDRVLWRRRKPRSKCTENTVVDGGGKDSLVDIESECSEDDEEEENNTEDESRSGVSNCPMQNDGRLQILFYSKYCRIMYYNCYIIIYH